MAGSRVRRHGGEVTKGCWQEVETLSVRLPAPPHAGGSVITYL